MEIKASAGELAYLMEEINRLSPVNIEGLLEITGEECEENTESENDSKGVKMMCQTEIEIVMKNGGQVVWKKDDWDDYIYDGKFFRIQKNNFCVGFYNLDEIISIIVR